MRVAIVYFPYPEKQAAMKKIVGAVEKGFAQAGHSTEVIDAKTGSNRLPSFDYIAVISQGKGFGAKIPPSVRETLGQVYGLTGRRACAFVTKGFRAERALLRLMNSLESQGMNVNYSEVLLTENMATIFAAEAPVVRT